MSTAKWTAYNTARVTWKKSPAVIINGRAEVGDIVYFRDFDRKTGTEVDTYEKVTEIKLIDGRDGPISLCTTTEIPDYVESAPVARAQVHPERCARSILEDELDVYLGPCGSDICEAVLMTLAKAHYHAPKAG